jgi:hypothetical protein
MKRFILKFKQFTTAMTTQVRTSRDSFFFGVNEGEIIIDAMLSLFPLALRCR